MAHKKSFLNRGIIGEYLVWFLNFEHILLMFQNQDNYVGKRYLVDWKIPYEGH